MMIDMHSHIIPAIDDGCSNINETLDMVRSARDCGITKIFATPHFIQGEYENCKEDVLASVSALNDLLKISGIDIEIISGTEIMVCADIIDLLRDDKLCTLNNSRYILIEFPMNVKIPNITKLINDILVIGYIPIIAHPERYTYVQKNIKEAIKFVECGALLQLNVNSVLGDYGNEAKNIAIKLLKHNLIHLCGTDTHVFRRVYGKKLNKSLNEINKIVGDEKFKQIKDINPECIYNDKDIKTFDIRYKLGIFG